MNAETFDYVIVGGGAAGCVLAGRLSENPAVKVCLLEAGGRDDSVLVRAPLGFALGAPLGTNAAKFESVPQPGLNGRRSYQPRGKVLGGSTSINAMMFVRGHQRQRIPGHGRAAQCDAFAQRQSDERGVLPRLRKRGH